MINFSQISHQKQKGFTLIEMLVVCVIIAILMAISIPLYLKYVDRVRVKIAQSDILTLSAFVENERQRNLSYPTGAGVSQFTQWHPSSKSEDFTFDYESDGDTYKITAESHNNRLTGCSLTFTDTNTKTISEQCNTSW